MAMLGATYRGVDVGDVSNALKDTISLLAPDREVSEALLSNVLAKIGKIPTLILEINARLEADARKAKEHNLLRHL